MEFNGKTFWLIGASSGIGAALAPALASRGAVLALSARRVVELEAVTDACTGPVRPLVMPLDVTDKAQIDATYAELVAVWGRVDIVFYNAGIASAPFIEGLDTDSALTQIDVLYLGLVRTVGAVLPDMLARKSGCIIGMSSLAGYAGLPRSAAYSSAKNGVIAFLQSIRIELKRHGVQVITVNPGFVRTPLIEGKSFPKPFMIEPEVAVEKILKGLKADKAEIHFPWQVSWPLKILTALPRSVYEALAGRFVERTR